MAPFSAAGDEVPSSRACSSPPTSLHVVSHDFVPAHSTRQNCLNVASGAPSASPARRTCLVGHWIRAVRRRLPRSAARDSKPDTDRDAQDMATNAQHMANRDEPVPRLSFSSLPRSGTSTPASEAAAEQSRYSSAARLSAKLEETGISRNGIQDRLFNSLFAQIFPEHRDAGLLQTTARQPQQQHSHVAKPQFSLPQMSSNFRRFNARIGVVFVFQNRVAKLLSWRKPSHTASFLAIYTFVCLDPSLLAVLPFAVCLLVIMVRAFALRHPQPVRPDLSHTFVTRGPPVAPPPTVKPVPEMSKDFFRNMRDMQNSMEDFTVAHDSLVASVGPLTNFSDEKLSSAVFVLFSVACCLLLLVARYIPFRFVFLLMGWYNVGKNHPAVAKLGSGIDKREVKARQSRAKTEFENWVENDVLLDDDPEKREVEIFELQRANDGDWEPWLYSTSPFDPHSPARIGGDRPHGARFFEDVQAPEGWVWSDKKWSLDSFSQEWVDDRVITSVEIETDGERWVYDVDRDASSPAKSRSAKADWEESFGTGRQGEWRRRRWVRLVQRMTAQQRKAAASKNVLHQPSPFELT